MTTKPSPLLVGFHGYGETAKDQMKMLQRIPGIEKWTLCSIQALHPYYNRKGQIGYNWMTSEDRELRIQENVQYVNQIITLIKNKYSLTDTIVFHGFSQGTAMACRAALLGNYAPSGVMLLGGDIPPEFSNIDKMNRLHVARGNKDPFYSSIRWKKDVERIQNANLKSNCITFDGGHDGTKEYYISAAKFLKHYD